MVEAAVQPKAVSARIYTSLLWSSVDENYLVYAFRYIQCLYGNNINQQRFSCLPSLAGCFGTQLHSPGTSVGLLAAPE